MSKPYRRRRDSDTREPYALKGARTVRWGVVRKGLCLKRGQYLAGCLPNAEMGGVTVVNARNVSLSIPTAFAKADVNAMQNLGVRMDQSDVHIIQFSGEELA